MNEQPNQTTDDAPLLSYLKCPICNGKHGFDAPGGWIACGACGGVGSTAAQMNAAEAAVGAAHREWSDRNAK